MRIKDVPKGSQVQCCGNTAQILKHGTMGARVNVLKSEFDNTILGFQIWSNLSAVEPIAGMDTGKPGISKLTIGELLGGKVPLTLF